MNQRESMFKLVLFIAFIGHVWIKGREETPSFFPVCFLLILYYEFVVLASHII